MPASIKGGNRIEFLDGIRGLAILWIFSFHLMGLYFDIYGNFLGKIICHGHFGVEMFLIISGFVISGSAENILSNNGSALAFIKRRLARIYLPYFFCVIFSVVVIPHATVMLSTVIGAPLDYRFPNYSFSQWIAALTMTKTFTAENWSLSKVYIPINNPLWYLSIIVQIYLVTAIALLFKRQYTKIIIAITALSMGSFFPQTLAFIPYGLFLPYWPSFAVGILLFHLSKNNNKRLPLTPLIYGLCLLGLLLLIFAANTYRQLFLSSFVFSACCGFLIWTLYPFNKKIAKNPCFRALTFFGSFSFSLYLLHDPLYRSIGSLIHAYNPYLSYKLFYAAIFPTVIILSYLWYLVFERPFKTLGLRKQEP